MKIDDREMIFVRGKRRAAQERNIPVHVYPVDEPHVVEDEACWCEPDVEDFTREGGGVLFIHKRQTWQ